MRIGLFTDTYFPQVNGVATSVKTLADQLTLLGHEPFIFTTTDPEALPDEPENIIRLRSVPVISMPDRRFVMAGLPTVLRIAHRYKLDIIHTQTEFGVGILGKVVANRLHIPVIHTLHTKYEDYVHFVANGRLIRPSMIKYIIRTFLLGTEALICPSQMTFEAAAGYGIKVPIRVIPTGIELARFQGSDVEAEKIRQDLKQEESETLLLSLSRLSLEKNIQAVIRAFPEVIKAASARLVIVGEGAYREELEKLVIELELEAHVTFVGQVENDQVVNYYKAADFFISASTSETQGLTFSEALASGTPVIAHWNPYLADLVDLPEFGQLFEYEEAMAFTILTAINQTPALDPEHFQKKLYEISAENFGRKVAEFYKDEIDCYAQANKGLVRSLTKTPSTINQIFKKYGKMRK